MTPEQRQRVEAVLQQTLLGLGDRLLAGYMVLVRERVHARTVRQQYLRALGIQSVSLRTGVTIGLPPRDGTVAKAAWRMEAGGPSFNLRDVVKNKKEGKNGGWYINVPFDKSSGQAEAMIDKLASSDEQRGRALVALKGLTPSEYNPSTGTVTQFGTRLPENLVGKLKDFHAVDPLQGTVSYAAPYAERNFAVDVRESGQSGDNVVRQFTGYRSWRRLSEKSPPSKWQIPAQTGLRLADVFFGSTERLQSVNEAVSQMAPNIDKILRGSP